MLKNQRIGTRIGIGFGALLVGAAAAFGAAVWVGLHGQRQGQAANAEMADRVAAVQNLQVAQLEAVSSVRNAGLMTNSRAVKTEMTTYKKALQRLQEGEQTFAQRSLDDTSRSLLNQSSTLRQSAEPIINEAIEHVLALAGEEGAKVLSQKLTPIQSQWLEQLRLLEAHEKEVGQAHVDNMMRSNARQLGVLALLLVGILGCGAGFAVWLTRSVTTQLRKAVSISQQVAAGNLQIQIEAQGQDETANLLRALKTMVEQLSSMVRSVRDSSQTISSAAQEISQGNLDLSMRTERQAATLEQTSASLSELAEAVSHSTVHTDSARELAERTATTANLAGSAMGQVASTMSRISDSSKRIGDIIGVIDGIAFQTNILALNAAVEAARAGEQGRGFAVVAGEVRALAQRVTSAASEVRTLITESVVRVDDGSQQVAGMEDTMKHLVNCANQVKGLLEEIAQAASAQHQRISEVNTAVSDIDGVTQQNAALVEEVAAAAQSLVAQTDVLSGLVGRFDVDLNSETVTVN